MTQVIDCQHYLIIFNLILISFLFTELHVLLPSYGGNDHYLLIELSYTG